MKKIILVLSVFCLSLVASLSASARGVIVYSNGEELKTLEKLPAECVIMEDGTHVNFGIHYESFSLFWMPVWNYGDYKYALVSDAEDTWTELTVEEAKAIGKEYKFDVPDQPTLPLLTQIGLKPVFILILLYILYSVFSGKKKEEDAVNEAVAKAPEANGTPAAPEASAPAQEVAPATEEKPKDEA